MKTKISKPVAIIRIVLTLIVLAVMVRAVMLLNFENVFLCLLVLLLFSVPSFIEKRLKIMLPDLLEVIILFFIFAAEILGELQSYYLQYPYWDTLLHTTWGFLCAAIGFSLVDILNQNSRIKFTLSPVFVAIVAFCFSMTVGVFWEFFEFGVDTFLHFDMQKDTVINEFYSTLLDPTKSNIAIPIEGIENTFINGKLLIEGGYLDIGLIDTMMDLFVNFIGALVFSVIGYVYIKQRGKGKLASSLIPTIIEKYEKDEANEK